MILEPFTVHLTVYYYSKILTNCRNRLVIKFSVPKCVVLPLGNSGLTDYIMTLLKPTKVFLMVSTLAL